MEITMKLTPEQEAILNGSKGEAMAKVMRTLVEYTHSAQLSPAKLSQAQLSSTKPSSAQPRSTQLSPAQPSVSLAFCRGP